MADTNLTVTGMEQLRARMNGLPAKLVKGAITAGLRQAANMVKGQARANIGASPGPNSVTGALKASIRVTQRRGTPDRVVFNVVAGDISKSQAARITKAQTKERGGTLSKAQAKKLGANSAYWALWVEKGHINRAMKQALRGPKDKVRADRAAQKASGSNTPAHPFMRPAIEQRAQAAISLMVQIVGDKLPEAAA